MISRDDHRIESLKGEVTSMALKKSKSLTLSSHNELEDKCKEAPSSPVCNPTSLLNGCKS